MWCRSSFVLFLFLISAPLRAATTISEAEFISADLMAKDIALWVEKMTPRPETISIFDVRVHEPLDREYAEVIENEIKESIRARKLARIIECPECKDPKVRLDGNRIIVTKGATKLEALKKIGQKLKIPYFMTVDVYRTTMSVQAQVNLFQSSTGDVKDSRSFRMPAVDFRNSSWLFLLNIGFGIKVGGKSGSNDDVAVPPTSASIIAMDELGFGKAGVAIGGTFTKNTGNIIHFLGNLAWRGRFMNSYSHSLTSAGLGWGFGKDKSGIYIRGAYDVFVGSLLNVGVDLGYLIPIQKREGSRNSIDGSIGLHVGLAFGR